MKTFLSLLILLPSVAQAALVSRIHTFADGAVLTASQLNTEYNNLIDAVNGIDNANIASGAAIDPAKISSTIAGGGITRNSSTGVLSVVADASTVEFSGLTLRVKDSGITTAKIDDLDVTTAKINDLAVTTGKINDLAVTTGKLAADAVTTAKILDGTIAAGDIGAGQIGNSLLSSSAVTSSVIVNGTITADDIGTDQVGSSNIAAAAVGQSELYTRTLTTDSNGSNVYITNLSSVNFTTTSTTATAVTNMSVTMTTTGRPVLICPVTNSTATDSVFTATGTVSGTCHFSITRSGTLVGQWAIVAQVTSNIYADGPPGCLIDSPAAASYDYVMNAWREASPSVTCGVQNMKLMVYEIN